MQRVLFLELKADTTQSPLLDRLIEETRTGYEVRPSLLAQPAAHAQTVGLRLATHLINLLQAHHTRGQLSTFLL